MSTVYNNKAYCLVELGKNLEALPFVNKALQLDKTESYIWDTRGEIYYNLGQFQNCIKDMSMAIQINSESENSLYYRGLAKIKLGNNRAGCDDLSLAGENGKKEAYDAIKINCK
jgi:tetratricopeptide (TPR) repeat protein